MHPIYFKVLSTATLTLQKQAYILTCILFTVKICCILSTIYRVLSKLSHFPPVQEQEHIQPVCVCTDVNNAQKYKVNENEISNYIGRGIMAHM